MIRSLLGAALAGIVMLTVMPGVAVAGLLQSTDPDSSPDFFPGQGGHPGPMTPGVLFLGYGQVGDALDLRDVTRQVGGEGGGECFAHTYLPPGYWDPVTEKVVLPPAVVDPCYYEAFCFYHRLDDIDEPDAVTQDWVIARASLGEDTFHRWRFGEPAEESVVQLEFCYAETRGVGDDLILSGVAPWGVTYTPEWSFVPIVDEVVDVVAQVQELWSLLEEPPIVVGGAPPVQERTIVQAETWVWVEEGAEPAWAVAVSPAQTAALIVRAKAVNTVWDFGDPEEDSVVECSLEQLVRFEVGVHDLMDPSAAGACSYRYLHTCFDSDDPGSQCAAGDRGFDLTVTITFEGEQALLTRPSIADSWPAPSWEPFAASKDVTSQVLEVPVLEILSMNG